MTKICYTILFTLKILLQLLRNTIHDCLIDEIQIFSTLLYLKFLVLWALVILADFLLEFRFEFLWPFWLLLRSVHDSFKYQGLVRLLIFELSILYTFYVLN